MLVCLGGWAVGILAGYPAPPPYIGRGAETRRPAQLLDPAYPAQTTRVSQPQASSLVPAGCGSGLESSKDGLEG